MKLATLLSCCIAVGAVAYVAQAAKPGETLYPVKTGITENAELALALDVESMAGVHARLFQKRIDETLQVTRDGVMTSDLAETQRQQIAEQFQRTFALLLTLERSGNLGAAQDTKEIIEEAIESYVTSREIPSHTIQNDLVVYRTLLTETAPTVVVDATQ